MNEQNDITIPVMTTQQQQTKKNPSGASFALAAAMAPMLLPLVTDAVTKTIGAVRGTPSGVSMGAPRNFVSTNRSVQKRSQKPTGITKGVKRAPQTPGSFGFGSQKVGISRKLVNDTTASFTMCDEIGAVTIPATSYGSASGLTLGNSYVSPACDDIHPVNYYEGLNWQNFKLQGVKLHYIPTAGDTQAGTAIMGYYDNPNSAPITDAVSSEPKAVSLSPLAVQFPVNRPCTFVVPKQRSWNREYNCVASAVNDVAEIAPGSVWCMASALDGSAHVVGKWFIEAEYLCMDRRPWYNGVGLAAKAFEASGRAKTEGEKGRARALLLRALATIYTDCTRRLEAPLVAEEQGLSESELKSSFATMVRKDPKNSKNN